MKRQILCPGCTTEFHDIVSRVRFDPEAMATGEQSKFVVGNSLVECRCDMCDAAILPGGACCAVSTFTKSRPYFAWESKYVDRV